MFLFTKVASLAGCFYRYTLIMTVKLQFHLVLTSGTRRVLGKWRAIWLLWRIFVAVELEFWFSVHFTLEFWHRILCKAFWAAEHLTWGWIPASSTPLTIFAPLYVVTEICFSCTTVPFAKSFSTYFVLCHSLTTNLRKSARLIASNLFVNIMCNNCYVTLCGFRCRSNYSTEDVLCLVHII